MSFVDDFWHYLTLPYLLQGAWIAIQIAVLSFTVATVLGYSLALVREARGLRALKVVASGYVWIVRGTPILLQLLIWYNVLPLVGIDINSYWTAVLALAVCYSAYMCEAVRSGLIAVDRGQVDAAEAAGLNPYQMLSRLIIPQATRVALPSLSNFAMLILKDTSLTSIIAVNELTLRSNAIVAQNLKYISVFAASTTIYLFLTSLITMAQRYFERRASYSSRERRMLRRFGDFAGSEGASQLHAISEFVSSDGEDSNAAVSICGVSKQFGGITALDDVSLDFSRGKTTVILGPSGSGKSTLLRTINHLERVSAGEILVNGRLVGYRRSKRGTVTPRRNPFTVAKERRESRTGMVFQQFNLFVNWHVGKNIYGPYSLITRADKSTAMREADSLLGTLQLRHLRHRMPQNLSGGEKQRIAILRMLALKPNVLLFDEPTSALDPEKVSEVLRVMKELSEAGATMIVVTHEIGFARQSADWVVFMENGKVIEQGSPSEFFDTPRTDRARDFLGSVMHGV